MADEQLRLVASLKDNASAGVRRIGRELKGVRVEPGMAQAQKWIRTFNSDVADFKAQTARVGGILTSMGVGGLAAGASVAALVGHFKQLADHVLDIRELGREIGITTTELRAMERAGQHFGLDPSKMDAALKRLAGMMPILRRGGNNELTDALVRRPDILRKVKGEADDIGAVFKDVVGYFNQLQNPQDRIKYFEQVFGDGDLEKLNAEGTGGFQKQLEAARKAVEPITKEAEAQAQALREAMIDFNASIEKLELRVAPAVFKGMKQAADDFRQAFGVIEEAYNWYKANRDHPVEAAGKSFADAVHDRRMENERHPNGIVFDLPGAADRALETIMGKKALGRDEFAPAKDAGEAAARVIKMQAELAALEARLRADRNPVGFPVREADTIARVRELREAIGTLQPAQVPSVAPLPPPRPPAAAFRVPSRYDTEMRARSPGDDQDHTADGVVVGALGQDVIHLRGTLRTMARQAEDGPVHQAAFHPAGLNTAASLDPVATIAAGTKEGVLGALRELQGVGGADGSTARGGMMPVNFGGGGGWGGGGSGGGGGGGNFSFSGYGNKGWEKSGATKAQVAAYIRHAFAAEHIDPSVALRIASAEGLHTYVGDHGTSFGAFQLHYGGSGIRGMNSRGLGDRFTAETGLDARDPTTFRQQIDFAAKIARREGWGAWHGRFPAHVGLRDGIGTYNGPVPSADDYDKGAGSSMAGLERVGKLASEECVALAAAAVRFRGSVTEWRKGVSAEAGTLKPGTPVSTFLDRQGREADRYGAGSPGGIGSRGVHLDHAGVFQRYITDQAGKIIGMTIAEQFKGSGGRHFKDYFFHRGWGEGDGSNYHAIMGSDGRPLGGANNPLSALRDAAEKLDGAADNQKQAAHVTAGSTIGTAHRLLKWMNKGSNLDDPSDTPISTYDMRDPKFAPPGWHDPNRPDLDREKRKADRAAEERQRIEGGIDAHVHIHDGSVRSAKVASSGRVRDARITVRTAPQRTFTV